MKTIKTLVILLSLSHLSNAQTVIGSGTTNNIPKFTASSTIGNSQIIDNGTSVSLGTASVVIGNTTPTSGDFVTILKSQNANTQLGLRSTTSGSAAATSFYASSLAASITMAAYNLNFIDQGIFEKRAGVLNVVGTGGLNLGTTSNAQVSLWTNNIKRVSVTNNGDVGIGTSTPYAKLDINGASATGLRSAVNHGFDYGYNTVLAVTRNLTKAFAVNNDADLVRAEKLVVWGNGRLDIEAVTKTDKYFSIYDFSTPSTPVESFAISGNGYTKINITNPSATDNVFDIYDATSSLQLFRIKADGRVFAREVEIKPTSSTFPDYVFSKEYNLMSLLDVEKYISTNKHLPGFEKGEVYDQNGFKTSELIYKQQEKIEELTLYIIELEKRIKAIEKKTQISK